MCLISIGSNFSNSNSISVLWNRILQTREHDEIATTNVIVESDARIVIEYLNFSEQDSSCLGLLVDGKLLARMLSSYKFFLCV